jgi:hypothetical protein
LSHQLVGFAALLSGRLRQPRFLLGCEMDFHALKVRQSEREWQPPGRATAGTRKPLPGDSKAGDLGPPLEWRLRK